MESQVLESKKAIVAEMEMESKSINQDAAKNRREMADKEKDISKLNKQMEKKASTTSDVLPRLSLMLRVARNRNHLKSNCKSKSLTRSRPSSHPPKTLKRFSAG